MRPWKYRNRSLRENQSRGVTSVADDVMSANPDPVPMPVTPVSANPDPAMTPLDVIRSPSVIRLVFDRNHDPGGRRRWSRRPGIIRRTGSSEQRRRPEQKNH